jgi:ferric-dicitrate binding protein FerR (iron transport regulator)
MAGGAAMKSKSILATLCSILLAYVSFAEQSNSQAMALLSSNGPAQVNGHATSSGAAIFAGDRVVSPDGASTVLSMTGGSRLILAGSGALHVGKTAGQAIARLENGSLAVLNRAGAPVVIEAAGTRISGGKGDSVYSVTVNGNNLEVMASKGETAVEGAGRTIEVGEGKTLKATMSPSNSADPQQSPPPAATGGYGSFFTFERVVLIASAAVSAVALGIAIKSLVRTCRATGSPSTVHCD